MPIIFVHYMTKFNLYTTLAYEFCFTCSLSPPKFHKIMRIKQAIEKIMCMIVFSVLSRDIQREYTDEKCTHYIQGLPSDNRVC